MSRRSYQAFIVDVHRLRPALAIVLAAITLIPSLLEYFAGDLPIILVLVRFAEALVVIGALVWSVSYVVLRYARTQATSEFDRDQDSEMSF